MSHPPDATGTVDVLLFSMLRERIGQSTISVHVDGPLTTTELLERIADEHPSVRDASSCVRIAVNQMYVRSSHVVRPGDEVALITPVSGG